MITKKLYHNLLLLIFIILSIIHSNYAVAEKIDKIRIGFQDHFVPVVAEGLNLWPELGIPVELKTFPARPIR